VANWVPGWPNESTQRNFTSDPIQTAEIATAAITNIKMAKMNAKTIKGNASAVAAAPQDMSPAEVLALLGNPGGSAEIGTLAFFAMSDPPAGWLELDGAEYNVADYPLLVERCPQFVTVTGNTFVINDLRSKFIRATDASNFLGTVQGDAARNITGKVDYILSTGSDATGTGALYWEKSQAGAVSTTGSSAKANIMFDASRVVPTAAENRPVNFAATLAVRAVA
jgi:hypothetical protein